jgi:putative addiction module CopG family antidote
MSISLTPELEAYVQQRAEADGFSSPEEFVREALRRMMAEERRHEAAVLDGLRNERGPLTREELDEVRKLATRTIDYRNGKCSTRSVISPGS